MIQQGGDLSQACKQAGLTNHPKIGEGIGVVGILTSGRMTREDTIQHSIRMAMTAFENASFYA